MVNFREVVSASRDAQLRQNEREQGDLAFLSDVVELVRQQVEAEEGQVLAQGDWARLAEHATGTFTVRFPPGCNVEEVGLTVAAQARRNRNVFMVGPAGRTPEPSEVKDRQEAADLVMAYLMDVVGEVRRLHE